MDIPGTRQLEIVRTAVLLDIFIHRSESEPFGEILTIICIGKTPEISIIIRAPFHQSPVIFYMYGERRLPEFEFAGNLPVGRSDTLFLIIHIYKEVSASPLVCPEHFDGRGQGRPPVQVFVVKSSPEIIVQLNILRFPAYNSGQQKNSQRKEFFHPDCLIWFIIWKAAKI